MLIWSKFRILEIVRVSIPSFIYSELFKVMFLWIIGNISSRLLTTLPNAMFEISYQLSCLVHLNCLCQLCCAFSFSKHSLTKLSIGCPSTALTLPYALEEAGRVRHKERDRGGKKPLFQLSKQSWIPSPGGIIHRSSVPSLQCFLFRCSGAHLTSYQSSFLKDCEPLPTGALCLVAPA